jgi:hypothetical protein
VHCARSLARSSRCAPHDLPRRSGCDRRRNDAGSRASDRDRHLRVGWIREIEPCRSVGECLGWSRIGARSTFRPFGWGSRSLGAPQPIPRGDVLIVDLIGLLRPELDDVLDLKIWCDVDLATATAWGRPGMRGSDGLTTSSGMRSGCPTRSISSSASTSAPRGPDLGASAAEQFRRLLSRGRTMRRLLMCPGYGMWSSSDSTCSSSWCSANRQAALVSYWRASSSPRIASRRDPPARRPAPRRTLS